jgi:hypothetical protein
VKFGISEKAKVPASAASESVVRGLSGRKVSAVKKRARLTAISSLTATHVRAHALPPSWRERRWQRSERSLPERPSRMGTGSRNERAPESLRHVRDGSRPSQSERGRSFQNSRREGVEPKSERLRKWMGCLVRIGLDHQRTRAVQPG